MSKARKDQSLRNLPKVPDINEEIFRRAGITDEDRAVMLKKVFDKTMKRLDASTRKVFCSNGEVIYSKPMVDHVTRGKAIDQAMSLGLVGVKKQEAPKVTIKAVVRLPSYATKKERQVKDITPTPSSIGTDTDTEPR